MAGIGDAMRHLSDRQRVIAQNVANSDTAGYKAREVEAPDFSHLVSDSGKARIARPRIEITSGMAALGARQQTTGNLILDKDISEIKPNGNNVTLEDQLLKMGQVQADFAALSNLYRKQMSLLKTATGKN